jgi:hypothetical protein
MMTFQAPYIGKSDFGMMLSSIGMDAETMQRLTDIQTDRVPMPKGEYPFTIKPSRIHGEGVFASTKIENGGSIGPMRVGLNRTPLGYKTNHSSHPNAISVAKDDGSGDLVALRPIEECEEITIDYRHAILEAKKAESMALMGPGLVKALHSLEYLVSTKATRLELRTAIQRVEDELLKLPQADHGLEHLFCDKLYIRKATILPGTIFTTPFYREECVLTMLKGKIVIVTEDGVHRMEAPDFVMTKPGTKRVIFALNHVEAHTVHPNPTNEQDISVLESRIYSDQFEEAI